MFVVIKSFGFQYMPPNLRGIPQHCYARNTKDEAIGLAVSMVKDNHKESCGNVLKWGTTYDDGSTNITIMPVEKG